MDKKLSRLSPALRHALGLVESMGKQAYLLLPEEPTLVMAAAGARAGHTTRTQARTVYRAMARVGRH
jgi:hypothetical protein